MINIQSIKNYVEMEFPRLGVNKEREVSRLLFEISKRDNCHFSEIISGYDGNREQFDSLKAYLLKKRFPNTTQVNSYARFSLPEVSIKEGHAIEIKKKPFTLKNVFVEREVAGSELAARLKVKYPKANFELIDSYSAYTKANTYGIGEYNRRMDSFFLIKEKYEFFRHCPCSTKSVSCNYHVVNLGSGCAFECTYCFLQDYLNSPGIVFPANIEDFFKEFESYKQNIRVGSGELTDSLVFDHITEFSPRIIEFFKKHPGSEFEFKTKSNNVDLLIDSKPTSNIIVSWSVNPQSVIEKVEFYTASLEERLEAAQRCIEAGARVAFHFDPIIYFKGWEKEYEDLINTIFDRIPEDAIYCLSLGTLRMSVNLKKVIENRFPRNTILNEEFVVGHDKKLRYEGTLRRDIYQKMLGWIKKRSTKVSAYLCMEEKAVCADSKAAPLKQYSK